MSIRFTIHIVMVSYQYISYLCYHKIQLLKFIWLCCTSIYNEYVILLCFICNHQKPLLISHIIITKLFLSQKFRINSLVIVLKVHFTLQTTECATFSKASIIKTQQTINSGYYSENWEDGLSIFILL